MRWYANFGVRLAQDVRALNGDWREDDENWNGKYNDGNEQECD
jgi:hypothetical protein